MPDAWEKEFAEFMTGSLEPAPALGANVISAVKHDLLPNPARVALKLYGLGVALGVASLLVCPQFGLSYGPLGHTLHGAFMRFGAMGCAAICGALLLSVTTLLMLLSLSREELRVAYHARYVHSLCLAFSLLGIFLFLGASVVLSLGLLWLAGAMLGSIASYRVVSVWVNSPRFA